MPNTALRIVTTTIPVSGTKADPPISLQNYEVFAIEIPTLDTCTFTVSGGLSDSGLPLFRAIKTADGTQQLNITSTTGNFILDSTDCKRASGCSHVTFNCSAAQNTGARTIRVLLKCVAKI